METELINTQNEEYGITEYKPLEELIGETGIFEPFGKKCKLCDFKPKGKFRDNHFNRCYRVPMKIRKNIKKILNMDAYKGVKYMGICEYVWEEAWKMLEEEKEELQNYIDNIPALTESDLESPEIEESNSWNEEVEKKLKELEGADWWGVKNTAVLEKKFKKLDEKVEEYLHYYDTKLGNMASIGLINTEAEEKIKELESKNKELEIGMSFLCASIVDIKERMNGLIDKHNGLCSTLGTA